MMPFGWVAKHLGNEYWMLDKYYVQLTRFNNSWLPWPGWMRTFTALLLLCYIIVVSVMKLWRELWMIVNEYVVSMHSFSSFLTEALAKSARCDNLAWGRIGLVEEPSVQAYCCVFNPFYAIKGSRHWPRVVNRSVRKLITRTSRSTQW